MWLSWFFSVVGELRQSSTGTTCSKEAKDQDFSRSRRITAGRNWNPCENVKAAISAKILAGLLGNTASTATATPRSLWHLWCVLDHVAAQPRSNLAWLSSLTNAPKAILK